MFKTFNNLDKNFINLRQYWNKLSKIIKVQEALQLEFFFLTFYISLISK